MKNFDFKKQVVFALAFTGITWLLMSVLIFIFIKAPFTWDKLFYYFLVSVIIGAYGLYLLNKGRFFSRAFFIGAYSVAFLGLYYGAKSSGKNFGDFAALILMIIPLVTISSLGFVIDLNLKARRKTNEIKKG